MKSIGKYDQRVTFKELGQVPDGFGGTFPGLVNVLSTFARVEGVSTYTAVQTLQITEGKVKKFFIKVRKGFEPNETMLINYKGKDYTITTPQEVDNERYQLEWAMIGTTNTTNDGG